MISSSIEESTKQEYRFPKLMQSVTTGVIVLFMKESEGVIVGGDTRAIGTVNFCYDMDMFTDFEGIITLCNKVTMAQ